MATMMVPMMIASTAINFIGQMSAARNQEKISREQAALQRSGAEASAKARESRSAQLMTIAQRERAIGGAKRIDRLEQMNYALGRFKAVAATSGARADSPDLIKAYSDFADKEKYRRLSLAWGHGQQAEDLEFDAAQEKEAAREERRLGTRLAGITERAGRRSANAMRIGAVGSLFSNAAGISKYWGGGPGGSAPGGWSGNYIADWT